MHHLSNRMYTNSFVSLFDCGAKPISSKIAIGFLTVILPIFAQTAMASGTSSQSVMNVGATSPKSAVPNVVSEESSHLEPSTYLPSPTPVETKSPVASFTVSPAQQKQLPRRVILHIRLDVPYTKLNNRSKVEVLNVDAYPYPMLPLRAKKLPDQIPTTYKNLKGLIYDASYVSRATVEMPYPAGGWHWRYTYQRALKRSGLTVPHTMASMYAFPEQIMPYLIPEIKRTNKIEADRLKRYKEAVEDYQQNRADVETEALQRGLYPVEIKMRKLEFGNHADRIQLAPGPWWVVASYKIPALSYYWQLPIRLAAGTEQHVLLTQDNAMLIEGAW